MIDTLIQLSRIPTGQSADPVVLCDVGDRLGIVWEQYTEMGLAASIYRFPKIVERVRWTSYPFCPDSDEFHIEGLNEYGQHCMATIPRRFIMLSEHDRVQYAADRQC